MNDHRVEVKPRKDDSFGYVHLEITGDGIPPHSTGVLIPSGPTLWGGAFVPAPRPVSFTDLRIVREFMDTIEPNKNDKAARREAWQLGLELLRSEQNRAHWRADT